MKLGLVRAVLPVIAAVILFAPVAALAQGKKPEPAGPPNYDAGKTPPQLFASDCGICHKSPLGLAKAAGLFGLERFLREHYTSSREAAAMLARYLEAVGEGAKQGAKPGAKPPARAATKRAPKGELKGEQRAKTGEPAANKKPDGKKTGGKPSATKSSDSKPAAEGATKDASPAAASDSKPAESKPVEPKPAEEKKE